MKLIATGLLNQLPGNALGRLGLAANLSIATMLLLPLRAIGADTSYTATGWVTGMNLPEVTCTNAACQVLSRGNAHTVAVRSSDLRLTGKRVVYANASYLPDGTAQVWGTAYQQVGTFDSHTNFTATAGVWEINYSGVMDTNFSLNLSVAGYGSGGAIDGQRIEETMTRQSASGLFDFTLPYVYTGTIKDAPVNSIELVDNFDDNKFTGTSWGHGICYESNQQFCVVGDFTIPTTSVYDSYVFGGYAWPQALPDGMTWEWRVDLVRLDENGTNTAILAAGTGFAPGYGFHLSRDFAFLAKWSQPDFSILHCERKTIPTTNIVMALALTRMGPNLSITARVLDKANPGKVLYELGPIIDTPESDPALNGDQFRALTGITLLDLVPDPVEAPPEWFYPMVLGVFKNTDGKQPSPLNIFDNLELLKYEVPRVSLSSAVQLTWPALAAGMYTVEWGPTPAGPWQPQQDLSVPGRQQLTLPVTAATRFFRLRKAPEGL